MQRRRAQLRVLRQGLSGAKAGGDDFLVSPHLVSEVRHSHAKRLRVIVGAMARALLRAKRTGQVVVCISDICAMLRIKRYLKKVGKRAAVAVRAAGPVGTNCAGVNDVIAGRVLGKSGNSSAAIDAL